MRPAPSREPMPPAGARSSTVRLPTERTHGRREACRGTCNGDRRSAGSSRRVVLRVIADVVRAFRVRTVRTAEEGADRLDAVADDLAAAVTADGGQPVDGALEAVERVRDPGGHDLKRHVVVIAAHFALGHGALLERGAREDKGRAGADACRR